ncbi:MAG: hypothetical protein ABI822_25050 [Bryobacteraceae bacterium]
MNPLQITVLAQGFSDDKTDKLHVNPVIVFLILAFAFAPAIFFNTVFHAGASLLTTTYCRGVLTVVLIYLPLFALISTHA